MARCAICCGVDPVVCCRRRDEHCSRWLTYERPRGGLYVWVNARGDGHSWEQFNLAANHNRTFTDPGFAFSDEFVRGACPPHTRTPACSVSSSYTGVAPLPDGESAVIVYDRYGVRPGEPDRIFTVRVRVSKTDVVGG